MTVQETQEQANRREALTLLAQLGGQFNADEDVKFSGKTFILPETTNLKGAIKTLTKKLEEDEQLFSFTRKFDYRPLDGARATGIAIRKAFGFSLGKEIRTFFGKQLPEFRDVKTSINTTEQVPWGAMTIPGMENTSLYLGGTRDPEYGVVFSITVEAPRKFRYEIEGLMLLIEEELKNNSIYRGKAIDGREDAEFLDLDGVDPEDVIYTEDVLAQLEANVWSPIRHAEALAKLGQPGKRAALFEGPYGTGKTLGAFLTAQVAVKHGWTFVYCRPAKDDLSIVMQTARLYQPSVVFVEDLDNMVTAGDDEHISQMLDLFDGIQAKGLRMLLVLTTNHVERLHKGMMRPGRLDAVISIADMDRAGVERLAHRVMADHLDSNIDFNAVHEALVGFMPAFVREAFDRAIRYSIASNDGELGPITTEDLVQAANGLRPQLQYMEEATERTDKDSIAGLIRKEISETVDGAEFVDHMEAADPRFWIRVPTANDKK